MHKSHFLALIIAIILSACTSSPTIKRLPPAPSKQPDATQSSEGGGYYPGDGPHASPPDNLDSIPDAVPKVEALYQYSTKPYIALGKKYTPLTSAAGYKRQGIASWYGKLFHGNKTAMGETYDMYSMTAAHTILPLPSYAKVTNLDNGRSVIVRINDRGPFKHSREIDLSYAAAHKLRLIEKGSGMVEVEAIDPNQYQAKQKMPASPPATPTADVQSSSATTTTATGQIYIQAGAFSQANNANELESKIEGLSIEDSSRIKQVYNNGLYRLMVGPYQSRQTAETVADTIQQRLNISTMITTQ